MSDVALAFARRLHHHIVNGGSVSAEDLDIIIRGMEHTQHDLEVAQSERDRLAVEHAKAQRAVLPWIEQVGRLNAAWDRHVYALRRIGMPGKEIAYCRDGHEMAVLEARAALKEDENE